MSEVVPLHPEPEPEDQGESKAKAPKIDRAVGDAIRRWHGEKPQKKKKGHAPKEHDEAIEHLDDLLGTPLGQAWLTGDTLAQKQFLPSEGPGIIGPLPRRKVLDAAKAGEEAPPMAKKLVFTAGIFRTFARLVVWFWGAVRFFWGNFVDWLNKRNTIERRAVRLREIFETMGPTFIKVGQQLSIRADILPYAYCEELAKMLDQVPPFPFEKAKEAIERSTGKPIIDTFAIFDPEPIGSASLACVYQAVLRSGDHVAVKVRRPDVGELLTADLNALDLLLMIAEAFTLVRTGMTRNLRVELRNMLMEELSFNREARFTELFRKLAIENKQNYISAPRVYFELSGDDVLVTEYISGVSLSEVLGALDRGDDQALVLLKQRDVDPIAIAKRMTRAFNWVFLENLIFNADPHPANVIIRPGNTIVFIDFGSCGSWTSVHRRKWLEMNYHLVRGDVTGLVNASIGLIEPVPPIDMARFTKEVEVLMWDWLYASKSDHAAWWERSTGRLWLSFVGIARRHNVPLSLDTLRKFRTTLVYDSMTFRLWSGLDLVKEYRSYVRDASRRARKRVLKALRKRAGGPTDEDFFTMEDNARLVKQIRDFVQSRLDRPSFDFASRISKAAYGVSVTLQLAGVALGLHVIALLVVKGWGSILGREITFSEGLDRLTSSTPYQVIAVFFILLVLRRVVQRLQDIDIE
jgi:ubiquinone biosynthesis protein